MHPTYLSAIERGLRNPTWTKLTCLAQALQITVAQLVHAAEAEYYGAIYQTTPATHRKPAQLERALTPRSSCAASPPDQAFRMVGQQAGSAGASAKP